MIMILQPQASPAQVEESVMALFRFYLGACLLLLAAGTVASTSHGQGESSTAATARETAEEQKERITAERFLQLLKKRPRLGTALDRIYGYHVGRGSLDEFCAALEAQATRDKDGNLWLILGMVQMQRGQDAVAAACFGKAEDLLPKAPLASYYLGKTLVLLGEVDKAVAAMRRAIERQPARADMLAIFQNLGRIYQRTGRNQEALDVWQQLEAQFPGDSQVQEEIARTLAEEGALEAALERYTALSAKLKDRFRQIEMAIRAAQLKAQLGKTDAALADFEKQLALVNPDSWLHRDVRRRIEEVFWSSGDIDGLVAYYTKWVKEHPEDVDAMLRTARFLSVQRRMPEAEKWFRDAIAKAPSKTEPRLALVEALVTDDRYAQAAQEMAALVKLEPDNPDYIVRWGDLVYNDSQRTEQRRTAEANDIWRGLLRKRSDDPVTLARLADLLRGTGSSAAAIEYYNKAIGLAPNEPQYREYLGEYLHQLGRKQEALATWRELAAGPRETRDNWVRLSEVFSTFHYPDEALDSMATACAMKPTFGAVRATPNCYARQNNMTKHSRNSTSPNPWRKTPNCANSCWKNASRITRPAARSRSASNKPRRTWPEPMPMMPSRGGCWRCCGMRSASSNLPARRSAKRPGSIPATLPCGRPLQHSKNGAGVSATPSAPTVSSPRSTAAF
jgi:tetratricopeptide (TPR) repeat protein